VTLTTEEGVTASADFLPVNNSMMPNFVAPGDDVFIGQYLFTGAETSSVYLKVEEVDQALGHIYCTVVNDARLSGVGRCSLTVD